VEPFQCSASVPWRSLPAAQQLRVLVQAMLSSPEVVDPAAGTLTSDHAVPFHRCAKGKDLPDDVS
jgi:hypothetical protein